MFWTARRPAALLTAATLSWVAAGCGADPASETAVDPGGSPAATAAQAPPEAPEDGAPTEVRVPEIGVSSELLHLGVEADGSATVPEDFDSVSWYDRSGRPDETRPTVMLGHVDSAEGPAVFHRLEELDPGDTVEVDTASGSTAEYTVTEARTFPKDSFPTFEVFGATGEDVLRLVTCTGDFDPNERSYTDNLVVFAARSSGD